MQSSSRAMRIAWLVAVVMGSATVAGGQAANTQRQRGQPLPFPSEEGFHIELVMANPPTGPTFPTWLLELRDAITKTKTAVADRDAGRIADDSLMRVATALADLIATDVSTVQGLPDALQRQMLQLALKLRGTNYGNSADRKGALDAIGALVASFDESEENLELLPRATLGFSGRAPTLNLTVAQYTLWFSETKGLPLFILAGLPTLNDTTLKTLRDRLLDEYGGLANFGGFKRGRVPGLDGFPQDELLGVKYELRGSGRLIETRKETKSFAAIAPVGTGFATMRGMWPVTKKLKRYDPNQRQGLLTLTLNGGGTYAGNRDYIDVGGKRPKSAFGFVGVYGSFFILNQFSVSGGKTWSNDPALGSRYTIAVSADRSQ